MKSSFLENADTARKSEMIIASGKAKSLYVLMSAALGSLENSEVMNGRELQNRTIIANINSNTVAAISINSRPQKL